MQVTADGSEGRMIGPTWKRHWIRSHPLFSRSQISIRHHGQATCNYFLSLLGQARRARGYFSLAEETAKDCRQMSTIWGPQDWPLLSFVMLPLHPSVNSQNISGVHLRAEGKKKKWQRHLDNTFLNSFPASIHCLQETPPGTPWTVLWIETVTTYLVCGHRAWHQHSSVATASECSVHS